MKSANVLKAVKKHVLNQQCLQEERLIGWHLSMESRTGGSIDDSHGALQTLWPRTFKTQMDAKRPSLKEKTKNLNKKQWEGQASEACLGNGLK